MKTLSIILLSLLAATFYDPHVKPVAADFGKRKTDSIYFFQYADVIAPNDFNGKIFEENAYFSNSHFGAEMNFSTSYFKKDAVFTNVTFKSFADFSGGTFLKDLNFSSCKFHKFLFLSRIFTDSVTALYFYNAGLPELIDFSHNIFLNRTVDFTNANFDSLEKEKTFWKDRRHFINIYNTDITRLKIGYTHFKMCFYDPEKKDKILTPHLDSLKKMYTVDTIVNSITIKTWNERVIYNKLIVDPVYKNYIAEVFPSAKMKDTVIINFTHFYTTLGSFPARLYEDQIDALYSRLLMNFETNGQMDSHKLLDIDYQDYRWANKITIISWFYIFPKYWNFYGHNRELIFAWTIFFLMVFTLISYFFYDRIFVKVDNIKGAYNLENGPTISTGSKHPRLNKFKCAFIYTSLIFFTLSIKIEKLNFKRQAVFYVVTINIFGLLCLAYLASFILQNNLL